MSLCRISVGSLLLFSGLMSTGSSYAQNTNDSPGSITGTVSKPDRTPAKNVTVRLLTLGKGKYKNERTRYETDRKGRFSFTPLHSAFRLVVIDEAGYAIRDFELGDESYDLALNAPASIEGTVSLGGEAVRHEMVQVTYDRRYNNGVLFVSRAKTDRRGQYVLKGLPSGEARVELITQGRDTITFTHRLVVDLESGHRVRADIGGTGRPVVGKVTLPEETLEDVDFAAYYFFMFGKTAPLVYPESIDRGDYDLMGAWLDAWERSDEGRARRAAQRMFAVGIEPNGEFRLLDIPEGEYFVRLHFTTTTGKRAEREQEFSVPAGIGAFDLGELELDIMVPRIIKVGDVAPLFEVESLDGVPVKLSDFRGKYVLLDFWATWCGPCKDQTPYLLDVFNRFDGSDRFAMIGLSVDLGANPARDYTTENKMDWTQVFLGDQHTSPVMDAYGFEGIPKIILIGPDGKVVATRLRKSGIADAVGKFLD